MTSPGTHCCSHRRSREKNAELHTWNNSNNVVESGNALARTERNMFLTTNGTCIEELSERRDGIIFDTNISWAFWKVLMAGDSGPSIRRMQKVHGQPSSAFGAKALIIAGLIHFGIPKSSPKLRQWWWWPCVCSTGFAWGLSLIMERNKPSSKMIAGMIWRWC